MTIAQVKRKRRQMKVDERYRQTLIKGKDKTPIKEKRGKK